MCIYENNKIAGLTFCRLASLYERNHGSIEEMIICSIFQNKDIGTLLPKALELNFKKLELIK